MLFPIQKDNPVEIYQFIFASNLKRNEQKLLEFTISATLYYSEGKTIRLIIILIFNQTTYTYIKLTSC